MRDSTTQPCNRSEDLIAFLYHEMNDSESRSFEAHLRDCVGCNRELASFGEIRESIVSWRDESLAAAWSQNGAAIPVVQSRPSALAALREFFNLSPVWMKGAAAFASLLFCVCAVLAVAYMRTPKTTIVKIPDGKVFSQAELTAAVEKKAQEVRNEFLSQTQTPPVTVKTPTRVVDRVVQQPNSGFAAKARDLRKPLSRQERMELAVDLGLLSSREDDDIDLITDKITPMP
jgi:anti-sigma factor RsiW